MLLMLSLSLIGKRKMTPMLARTTKEDLAVLAQMLESGAITPVIDRRYSLAEVPEALRYQGAGHAQGKTVITVSAAHEE